ncbi:hypothetical protein FHS20_003603 [Phyllobacterium endophyticum]|nr:hypothetical protein [Phyllobacterium endophyticum]
MPVSDDIPFDRMPRTESSNHSHFSPLQALVFPGPHAPQSRSPRYKQAQMPRKYVTVTMPVRCSRFWRAKTFITSGHCCRSAIVEFEPPIKSLIICCFKESFLTGMM